MLQRARRAAASAPMAAQEATTVTPARRPSLRRCPSCSYSAIRAPPLRPLPCAGREGRVREDIAMAKEELLEFEGEVIEVLPDGNFRVRLDNEHQILAYTAGKMRKFRIRTGVGDRVIVEMSRYDLQRGRISLRHKGDARSTARQQRRPNFRGRR